MSPIRKLKCHLVIIICRAIGYNMKPKIKHSVLQYIDACIVVDQSLSYCLDIPGYQNWKSTPYVVRTYIYSNRNYFFMYTNHAAYVVFHQISSKTQRNGVLTTKFLVTSQPYFFLLFFVTMTTHKHTHTCLMQLNILQLMKFWQQSSRVNVYFKLVITVLLHILRITRPVYKRISIVKFFLLTSRALTPRVSFNRFV